MKKLSSLEVIYFEDAKFRNLMEQAKESLDYRPQQMIDNLFYFFQSFLQTLIAFVALVQLNWIFIILIVVVTVPEFINQNLYAKLAWGIWAQNSPFRKRFDYLMRILQGTREFKEVKIFQLAGKMLEELKNLQDKFYVENKGLAKKYYKTSLVYNGLSSLVFVGIEIFVIFQALARRVTVGDINFYTGVVSNFQYGLSGVLRTLNNVFEHSLYVKSMFEILDAKPLLKQAKHPVKLSFRKPPKIEFKNVEFVYPGSKEKILKGFNLTINPGEKVAFVGENGVGKTTVIKLLARFYDVSTGEILVNGHNLKSIDLINWYKNIGILFQDFNKYEHTVKENIYFGKISMP
ncbi:MAG: ABC transporter ATP-binding protein, partial [Candidatus Daviesbacteria bacterium]|nr:ABC transporter ATP-binding protein [Candidatus Daviesbacteria bacterium]